MVLGNRRPRRVRHTDPVRQELQKSRENHARNKKQDYSHCFRSKSRWDFLRLSCVMSGVELAYAAEMAFVSPILLKIGVEHWVMTMVWGISPFLGFIMSPLIGSFSDRCRSKYGRRRPLIVILSAGIVAGLLLIPHCLELGNLLGDPQYDTAEKDHVYNGDSEENTEEGFKYKWALVVTIIGTILLDFNADICQSPARAYLLDVSIAEDHSKGLSAFGIMCGVGSCCGFVMCTIDWESFSVGQWFGGNVSTVFTTCTLIVIVTIICTVTSFREIPLPLMEADEMLRPVTQAVVRQEYEKRKRNAEILKDQVECNGYNSVAIDAGDSEIDEESEGTHVTLIQYLQTVLTMPKSIRILCITHLFTKMALLSYSLYFTDFVGEVIFHGAPTGPTHLLYEQGVRFGCWGLAAFALSCTMYSFAIEHLIKLFGAKIVYIGGLSVFSLGMIVLAIWPMKWTVIIISFSSGIMYATAFTIPYLVLAQYHSSGSFKQKNGEQVTSTQIRGLGTDVSILHSMIFVGQMIVSFTSGPLINLINSVQAVIYAAGAFAALSAISASQIVYMDL